MNHRQIQVTFVILLMLALLVTACVSAETPIATLQPTSPTIPTHTPVPPTLTPETLLQPGWTSYTAAKYVRDMTFDHEGNLWTVGFRGVVKLNPIDNTYVEYTTDDGLAINDVESIAVAPDGVLWFGTKRGGVSAF